MGQSELQVQTLRDLGQLNHPADPVFQTNCDNVCFFTFPSVEKEEDGGGWYTQQPPGCLSWETRDPQLCRHSATPSYTVHCVYCVYCTVYAMHYTINTVYCVRCILPSWQGFRPLKKSNSHLNLDNSSLIKCLKPSLFLF